MKPQATLRQWPTVNFLDEIEAPVPEPRALYDLACREPAIRRAYRKVQSLGKTLQARIGGPTWAGFADARTNFQTALFELLCKAPHKSSYVERTVMLSLPRIRRAVGRDAM